MRARTRAEKVSSDTHWKTYLGEARRPVVSLAFVAPMLLVYELGILILGPEAMRNGADVWLRNFLDEIGFGQYFLLPILTVFALLGWNHISREPWSISPRVIGGMLMESVGFGFFLLTVAHFQAQLMAISETPLATSAAGSNVLAAQTTRMVGYFGAGIYEELLFRLMLLPVVTGLVRSFGATRLTSLVTGIVITGLLFSAAHYRVFTSTGDAFQWFSFTFRFIAGVFFAVLFTYRGFGITAGAHTLYDLFAASI